MLPRELLEGDSLPALRINTWRFIAFLMREHLRHGGKENGFLQAPREQLEKYGIGSHFISDAINQAEQLGLVHCQRGIGKRSSLYALTSLLLRGGVMTAVSTSNDCQTAVTNPVATAKQQSLGRKSRGAKQQYLSRDSYQGGAVVSQVEGQGKGEGAAARSRNGHAAH